VISGPESGHKGAAARAWRGVALRILVAAAIFWWLFSRVNIANVREQLAKTHVAWVVAAVTLMFIQRVSRCFNWAQLLHGLGVRVPMLRWNLVQVYFAGGFLGAVVPSSASADAIRTLLVKRLFGGPLSGFAATVVLLNAMTWSAACTVGLFGIAVLSLGHEMRGPLASVGVLFVVVTVVIGIAYAMLRAHRGVAIGLLRRLGLSFHWLREFIRRFLKALLLMEQEDVRVMPVLATAVVAQVLSVVSLALLGSAVGIVVPFGAYLVAAPLSAIVGLVPASILGFGAMQAFHVLYFGYFGIEAPAALVMSALYTTAAVGIHLTVGATVLACNGFVRPINGGVGEQGY
jgi:hypothetical protein